MSDNPWCRVCNGYLYENHRCPLKYRVWNPENGDEEDGALLYAQDHEEAAEKWAELEDQYGDYCIVGGSEVTVKVRLGGEQDIQEFCVTGESVPMYHAERVPPKADEGPKP